MARKITVEFLGNASDLTGTVDKVDAKTSTLGSKLKKVGAVAAVGFAAAGAAAVKFGIDAVGSASDLNETLNKSEVIFGKQAPAMEKWASGAATSAGLSKQAALEAAAGFGDMFSQIGIAGKESAKMSKAVVQMSADLGSFNNLPTAEVTEMMSAAFRGEYDSLQRVIPNINAARVEHEALAMTGKKSASSLTAQEKAMATLAIVQKDGARAAGDFARTSDGLANQQKILAAQFENVKAKIGQALLPVLTEVMNFVTTSLMPGLAAFGGYLQETLPPIIDGIREVLLGVFSGETSGRINEWVTAIKEIFTGFVELVVAIWQKWGADILAVVTIAFDHIKGMISAALKIIQGVIKTVTSLIKGDWKGVWEGIKLILSGAWDAIKQIIKTALSLVKVILSNAWDAIKAVARAAWNGLKELIGNSIEGWKMLIRLGVDKAKDALSNAWEAMKDLTRRAWEGLKDLVQDGAGRLVQAVQAIPGKFRELGGRFKEAGKALIGMFVDGMKNAAGIISGIAGNVWDAVRSLLNGAITRINSALEFTIGIPGPDIHVNPPNIPHLAKGGIVTKPTLALIGEDGPEAVVPLGAKHRPTGHIPGMVAGNDGSTVANLTVQLVMPDGRPIQQLLLKLKRDNGGIALGLA